MDNAIQQKSGFRWRTQDGEVLELHEMGSRHLFFCVRMIWNNSCPVHLRLEPYKRWRLAKSHGPALKHLVGELATRLDDLDPWMIRQLQFMERNASGAAWIPE